MKLPPRGITLYIVSTCPMPSADFMPVSQLVCIYWQLPSATRPRRPHGLRDHLRPYRGHDGLRVSARAVAHSPQVGSKPVNLVHFTHIMHPYKSYVTLARACRLYLIFWFRYDPKDSLTSVCLFLGMAVMALSLTLFVAV